MILSTTQYVGGGAQAGDVLAPAGVLLAGAVGWDHGHPHWVH